MEKENLQQKIMEMDETIELLEGSNQVRPDTTLRMVNTFAFEHRRTLQHFQFLFLTAKSNLVFFLQGDSQRSASSEFSRRLAQSDMLVSHARHERSRHHSAAGSSRTRHGRHQ
jgi:kinesin family protein 15